MLFSSRAPFQRRQLSICTLLPTVLSIFPCVKLVHACIGHSQTLSKYTSAILSAKNMPCDFFLRSRHIETSSQHLPENCSMWSAASRSPYFKLVDQSQSDNGERMIALHVKGLIILAPSLEIRRRVPEDSHDVRANF